MAAALPAAATHASAFLTQVMPADVIHAALEGMAWIKRLIVEACVQV
jgi:hypothetical protein